MKPTNRGKKGWKKTESEFKNDEPWKPMKKDKGDWKRIASVNGRQD